MTFPGEDYKILMFLAKNGIAMRLPKDIFLLNKLSELDYLDKNRNLLLSIKLVQINLTIKKTSKLRGENKK